MQHSLGNSGFDLEKNKIVAVAGQTNGDVEVFRCIDRRESAEFWQFSSLYLMTLSALLFVLWELLLEWMAVLQGGNNRTDISKIYEALQLVQVVWKTCPSMYYTRANTTKFYLLWQTNVIEKTMCSSL